MGTRFQKSLQKLLCVSKSPRGPAESGVGGVLHGTAQGLWEGTVDGQSEHVQQNPEVTHLFWFVELTVACLLGQRSLGESLTFVLCHLIVIQSLHRTGISVTEPWPVTRGRSPTSTSGHLQSLRNELLGQFLCVILSPFLCEAHFTELRREYK